MDTDPSRSSKLHHRIEDERQCGSMERVWERLSHLYGLSKLVWPHGYGIREGEKDKFTKEGGKDGESRKRSSSPDTSAEKCLA